MLCCIQFYFYTSSGGRGLGPRCTNTVPIYQHCAFSVAAPTLWNRLLANIRNASSLENFKSLLKTHLFKVAFTDK